MKNRRECGRVDMGQDVMAARQKNVAVGQGAVCINKGRENIVNLRQTNAAVGHSCLYYKSYGWGLKCFV